MYVLFSFPRIPLIPSYPSEETMLPSPTSSTQKPTITQSYEVNLPTVCLINWLTGLSLLIDWLTDCPMDLTEWLSYWVSDWLTPYGRAWLNDCHIDWLTVFLPLDLTNGCLNRLTYWLTERLTDWLTVWLTDWHTEPTGCGQIVVEYARIIWVPMWFVVLTICDIVCACVTWHAASSYLGAWWH